MVTISRRPRMRWQFRDRRPAPVVVLYDGAPITSGQLADALSRALELVPKPPAPWWRRFLQPRVLDTPRSPARPSPGRGEEKNLEPRGGENGT